MDEDGPIEFNGAVKFLELIHNCRVQISEAIRNEDTPTIYSKMLEILVTTKRGLIKRGADEETVKTLLKDLEDIHNKQTPVANVRIHPTLAQNLKKSNNSASLAKYMTVYGRLMDVLWDHGFIFPDARATSAQEEIERDFTG